jgi:predicted nucleic acid-binding protein
VTAAKVVDASAIGAVLFAESAGERTAARLGDARLVAPALLAYELSNVCLKKIRANPKQRSDFLAAFASWSQMGIELVDVDQDGVLPVAEQFGLTAYDASYLWLAQRLDIELVTLDRRLARAADKLPKN